MAAKLNRGNLGIAQSAANVSNARPPRDKGHSGMSCRQGRTSMKSALLRLAAAIGLSAALIGIGAPPSHAADIIDEWASVKTPPVPELKSVTIDAKTTALLMLDFVPKACNADHSPRCIASLVPVKKLLDEARGHAMLVVYSGYGKFTKSDVLPPVAANESEPFVLGILNKYLHSDLEKILKDKGIQNVVTVGTAANGAVLGTASTAAELGFNVIVPVDGISAPDTYAEQYSVWDLTHAPVIAAKVTLTRIDMMKF
jgi:nicotinamidase-related amidase